MSDRSGSSGDGRRQLKVRVRTAKRRTASSTRWLERQLNDPYVARAKDEGYRARSAYKLIEIDDRYRLLAPGKRVVDLCAAPGGKTAQLILAGAEVTALDQSGSRLRRLKGNLKRLGLEAETKEVNMADFQPETLFDAALLDAPCSSTGTTRRHPDVLWTKGPEDIAKLAALQERLLRHALTVVKPGGIVVFSNCSLDPLEGEEVVERVVGSGAAYERVAISAAEWPGLEDAITPLGEMRTTPAMLPLDVPFASGLDGFYAAVIRRK